MVEYTFRPGFSARVPAAVVGAHIEALKKRNATDDAPEGFTTPEEIIEDARSLKSPIHDCFTWDVEDAAAKQLRSEARFLMRSYEIRVIAPDLTPVVISPGSVRVITPEGKSIFVTPPVAMSNAEYKMQVLRETSNQIAGLKERLRKLQGLSPEVFSALDSLIAALGREI